MHLTRHTDYALRVLIHLATYQDRLCSIAEIAAAHKISQNHLMKVVNELGHAGFIATTRGRGGGLRLARPPAEIGIGDVVRHGETDFALADCNNCVIAPACGLTPALGRAVAAFLAVLDEYSLADVAGNRAKLASLLSAF